MTRRSTPVTLASADPSLEESASPEWCGGLVGSKSSPLPLGSPGVLARS